MGLGTAGMTGGKFDLQTGGCIIYSKTRVKTKTKQLESIIGLEEWAQSSR